VCWVFVMKRVVEGENEAAKREKMNFLGFG
jgi:hypothetical protein